MDWINLAQKKDKWCAVVNTFLKLQLRKCREFCEWLRNQQFLKEDFPPWH